MSDYTIDSCIAEAWAEHTKRVEHNEPVHLTFRFLYPGSRIARYEPLTVTDDASQSAKPHDY